MIALIISTFLEIDGPPLQLAQGIIEIPVHRPRIDDRDLADQSLLVPRL
jgi:hypothetical protein